MRTPRPCVLPRQPATRAVLLASGLTPQMIRTQLASGRLMRVRRGVFLDAERWPEEPAARHLVIARAELVVHPVAVMSHQSAAIVWGLPHPGFASWTDEPPAVTLPADGRVKSASGAAVRHHVARLPLGQVTDDEEGYPVTTFYPDCLWPEQGLVGECDGAVKYADASAYVREKEREQALRDQGWRVVRWLAREIMLRPGVVVERVARALGA